MLTKELRIGYSVFLGLYLCFQDKNCGKCHVYEYPTPGDTLFATLHNNQPNLKSSKKSHKYLWKTCRGHEKGRDSGHQ